MPQDLKVLWCDSSFTRLAKKENIGINDMKIPSFPDHNKQDFLTCDAFVIGVNRNLVVSDELGVCLGVVLPAELGVTGLLWCVLGVTGLLWCVLGALNFGEDWNGEGVCGTFCCCEVGDLREGVRGRTL